MQSKISKGMGYRVWGIGIVLLILLGVQTIFAQPAAPDIPLPRVTFGVERAQNVEDVSVALELVALLTILSLAPSIIIMMTSFTRIVIVLNFVKQALGTQNSPPNQMVMGLSLFLTFFIMAPTFNRINEEALQPYLAHEINYQEGIDKAVKPIREFMLRQTSEHDLALFIRASRQPNPSTIDDLKMWTIIPAFVISELKTAFIIGFMIYIPFLVIDMAVASILMSMGMMMLPPMMVSMPFKLILFVLVDGWNLIVQQLLLSFH
ncbi:MAG: flagellar type III secretion system pore protein FliP [Fibromonadaceae bacterium]|jgi:flagellar biosynthetic protein FliP|nr:flagellar type III secretion system pore protein FliP [Fibromonadaceae bacterium]